jgi:flagellar assembly protein FliH
VKAGDHEVDAGCNQRLDACMEQVSAQLLEVGEPQTEAVEVTP